MKYFYLSALLLALFSCADSQQSDNEKESSESKIEIKGDTGEIKISKEGIKIEGKNGKIEIKTGDTGKISVEKKGKNVNIQIKEN